MRNKIYGYVLISESGEIGGVTVHESNHQQPRLLRTSKQIRQEAPKIHDLSKTFKLCLLDLKIGVWHIAKHRPLAIVTASFGCRGTARQ